MDYRREVDGLRAVAVLAVMFFHAGFAQVSGGFVGVDVFFVISGYLITSLIQSERAQGRFSLAGFYERRARRILPALFCVLGACVPFAWLWLLPDQLKDFSNSLVRVLVFLSNVYFARDTGYFAAPAEEKPLLHTWSLAVEEQYYLAFPLLLALLARFGKRPLAGALALLALASLAFAVHESGVRPEKAFFDTRGRVWELLIGALLALGPASRGLRAARPVRELGSALGLGAILWAALRFDANTPSPSAYMLLPTLGTALLLLFASPGTLVGRLLGSKPVVAIGLISYSAYLWHQPLLAFARVRSLTLLSALERLSLVLAALALAAVSWRLVEQPFRDRQRVARRSLVRAALVTAAVLLAIGLAGKATHGFEARYAQRWQAIQQNLEKLRGERDAWIRPGECQFNQRGTYRELDAFLSHWDCELDPRHPELKKIPYAVAGDSHAADLVMAFKVNGYLPLEMSGASCSLVPSQMSPSCARQFDQLKRALAERPYYTHLVLANRFTREELSDAAIAEMLGYWSSFGRKLVFLTAEPEYTHFKRLLLSGAKTHADFQIADLSERRELVDYLTDRGVTVVRTRELFCAMAADCGYADASGNLLLIDGHHLTRRGAELFGRALLAALPPQAD
jgi:peptidoglycan/LPS O-acetylase OafA/YrhL